MPFCMNCGKELKDDEKFCPACGTEVEKEEELVNEILDEPETKPVPKCFTIFAKIAKVFGLVTFICSFIPFVNVLALEIGPVGIVFSILGKKDPEMIDSCKKSLKFSIWGTVLGLVLYFVYIIVFAMLGTNA